MGIFVAVINYSFASSSIRPIEGIITCFESPLSQLSMPHDDTLVLTLEVGKHLMKLILINLSSVADLLYLPALLRLGYKLDNLCNLGRVLVGFNGSHTNSLGKIELPILTRPITSLVLLTMIKKPSSFNVILWCTWIHAMKELPFFYHQMLSFRTLQGQVDIRGDQKASITCCEVKHKKDEMLTN